MKKMILLATFCVAGLFNANGKVEKKIEIKKASVAFQLCGVLVTYYNSEGQPTGQQLYTSDQPDILACTIYQNGVIADLQRQGYTVKKAETGLSNSIY
ncbi:hypothetical protein [uncultured Chryseobacterium sp.]|jgi:hypothetical protein|uniref:hypothetical protein n=1 Tax=uncultured Chryseobacterium sp. TaxID=259322 RepID=UPI002610EC48|nr:hypothetical protein [uncultured Chryseobacterium sp.]